MPLKKKKKVPNMVAYFSEKSPPDEKSAQGGVWEGLERKENTKTDRITFLLSRKKNDRKGGEKVEKEAVKSTGDVKKNAKRCR